jgi:hypothetical protein
MSETASLLKAFRLDNAETAKHEDPLLREVSQTMRSWEKFLEAYRRQYPLADLNDSVLLEILNAKWLHERKRT